MAKDRKWAAPAAAGILAIILATQLWGAAPVLAHARYKSSSPAKGATVPIAPSQVEIVFTNDIQKIAGTYELQVHRDRGSDVTAGPPVVDDEDRSKLSVPLQADLEPGRYVIRWANVSDEDGDPADGAFSFYVGDYTPTAIDLENDAQLEQIGAEEGETPSTGDTPVSSDDTPAAGPTSGPTSGARPSPAPDDGAETADHDGGDNNALINMVIVGVAVAAVAVVAGFMLTRRRL